MFQSDDPMARYLYRAAYYAYFQKRVKVDIDLCQAEIVERSCAAVVSIYGLLPLKASRALAPVSTAHVYPASKCGTDLRGWAMMG